MTFPTHKRCGRDANSDSRNISSRTVRIGDHNVRTLTASLGSDSRYAVLTIDSLNPIPDHSGSMVSGFELRKYSDLELSATQPWIADEHVVKDARVVSDPDDCKRWKSW